MTIARHPVLSKANHVSLLPPSWRTLYELTQLPGVEVRKLVEGDVRNKSNKLIQIETGLLGTFSRTGYLAPETLSYDDWERIGRTLQHISGAVQWWVGDWLLYGERKYGEMYTQAMEESGCENQTLRNAKWVCSSFELSRRRDNLTFSHHAEVAALEPPDQDRLLDEVEKNGGSSRELRKRVRELKWLQDGTPPLPDGKDLTKYMRGEHDGEEYWNTLPKSASREGRASIVRRICRY